MNDYGLGPYLTGLRAVRGWSITDAAARIGMSKSHLSQLEKGKIGLPNAALRRQIADAYSVRHVDILVAAGELLPEEIAALPIDRPTDPYVAEFIELLPYVDEIVMGAITAAGLGVGGGCHDRSTPFGQCRRQ
jgi:transcriptional regulator with XRE-family HTH domain